MQYYTIICNITIISLYNTIQYDHHIRTRLHKWRFPKIETWDLFKCLERFDCYFVQMSNTVSKFPIFFINVFPCSNCVWIELMQKIRKVVKKVSAPSPHLVRIHLLKDEKRRNIYKRRFKHFKIISLYTFGSYVNLNYSYITVQPATHRQLCIRKISVAIWIKLKFSQFAAFKENQRWKCKRKLWLLKCQNSVS